MRDLVARREPLYEFAIRTVLRELRPRHRRGPGRRAAITAPLVARIKDEALRDEYAYNLDRWLGLNDQELVLARIGQDMRGGRRARHEGQPHSRAGAGRSRSPHAPDRPHAAEEPRYDLGDPVIQVEREALKAGHPAARPFAGPRSTRSTLPAFTARGTGRSGT